MLARCRGGRAGTTSAQCHDCAGAARLFATAGPRRSTENVAAGASLWGRAGKIGTMTHENLLAGPAPVLLPDNDHASAQLRSGADPAAIARQYPGYSAAWAALAARVIGSDPVTGYAYARTGYHRGLDQLRRAGWHGHGPVPWEHEPNRGFLRSLFLLGMAAQAIGEDDEARRCADFLRDSSPAAAGALQAGE
jgi:Protein of unknown function (DUF3151)